MDGMRLGDVIDDHCVKCRRVTNHSIVSIVDGAAAKVRCRTCYHDHDYRHEQPPPSKKDLKKAEEEKLYNQVLAGAGVPVVPADGVPVDGAAPEPASVDEPAPVEDAALGEEAIPAEEPAPVAAPASKKRTRKTTQ
jgi:hypothetical protein